MAEMILPLPHLQLRLLKQLCSNLTALQEAVLHQAKRAVEYGATPHQLATATGHWPAWEDVTPEPHA